ncbi:MAG: translation initiation factor IF-2 subunit beta [Candidatus Aenigmarchaeota archaeon]|nr:translation initiation factor IF-2 subunit beta [Candidatus Aenigmarchaeota archaeon]
MNYKEMLEKAKRSLPEKTEKQDRFEVPEPMVDYQGKQVIIKNFSEIARILRRDPKHISKFLFKELAVPGSQTNQGLLISGKVDKVIISKKINDYVRVYVRCDKCGKPDTNLEKKDRMFVLKCESCGAKKII